MKLKIFIISLAALLTTACSQQQVVSQQVTPSQQIGAQQQVQPESATADGECHDHIPNTLTNTNSHCHPNVPGVHMYNGKPMSSYQTRV